MKINHHRVQMKGNPYLGHAVLVTEEKEQNSGYAHKMVPGSSLGGGICLWHLHFTEESKSQCET